MKIKVIVITLLLTISIGASAITINQRSIGNVVFQTSGGLPLTAWTALSAFKSALNPITKAAVLYQGVKAIAPTEVANAEQSLINALGYIIPGMELDHAYYPPDWTDPNTPPNTQMSTLTWTFMGQTFSSAQAACDAYKTAYSIPSVSLVFETQTQAHCHRSDGYDSTSFTASSSCPTGYSLNQGTCNLTQSSSAKWPSNNIPTIVKDANKNWINHPKDPDSLTDSGIGTNTISRSGTDPHGNPTEETIISNPDGSTTYQRKSETIDQSTGLPVTNTTTIYMDSNGNVTNITENNQNNTSINNSNTNIGNGSGSTKIEIPPITVSGDGGQLNTTLQQSETAEEALNRLRLHLASNILIAPLINPTSASGTCPMNLQVNMGSFGNHSTNVMCDLYELMIPTLDTVTKFAWSLAAIFIFFSA